MIDTTKWTGLPRISTDAIPLGWCALGLLAAALGGRAPTGMPRTASNPRVLVERVERDSRSRSLAVLLSGAPSIVLGHVDPAGPDARDAIAMTAESPCLLRYRIASTLPGTDLAVRVRSPAGGELGGGFEAGVLAFSSAGEHRDLEVVSAWGSSCYSLELEVLPLPSRRDGAGR